MAPLIGYKIEEALEGFEGDTTRLRPGMERTFEHPYYLAAFTFYGTWTSPTPNRSIQEAYDVHPRLYL